ncbi:hypothetical protein [Streptomyces sp. B93]|uniref:hypothetical protein n=1 Tax=Streptomyces sp. B93 TaxID=2824875 RepID=UPI001B366C63|nr:hypothetical protein [Streptomyces sp. B93]MBQ1089645.1 hypothetical protein [Streptomyces sp. B93]
MNVPTSLEQNAHLFERFVATCDTAEDGVEEQEVYLNPLLGLWLERGNGIELTAGKYEYFLETALVIADLAMKGGISLDYEGPPLEPYRRRMVGIYDPRNPEFYDRRAYEMTAYRHQNGN